MREAPAQRLRKSSSRRPQAFLALALLATAAGSIGAIQLAAAGGRPAAQIRVRRDLRYSDTPSQPLLLDAFLPGSRGGVTPAVVLVHGGGWVGGGKWRWDADAAKLAALGWAAFSIDYRLSPRARFPAAVDDLRAAIRWIGSHARELHVDRRRIGLIGDSAGGTLVAYVAVAGTGSRAGSVRVRAAASWSGPTDLASLVRDGHSPYLRRVARAYVGCPLTTCAHRYQSASPADHVSPSSTPLLLANSTRELVPLAQALELADRLKEAGVRFRLLVFPGTRHARRYEAAAWEPTLGFLQRYLGRLPVTP
jgi:acetyl esterase/lipase